MSAFKKLDRRDVFTTVHMAKKSWSADAESLDTYGIEIILASTGSVGFPLVGNSPTFYTNYKSLKHLYYSNYPAEGPSGEILTGSFDNYLQSSLITRTRVLNKKATVFSFPKRVFGEGIEPATFETTVESTYIFDEPDYVLETEAAGGEYIVNAFNGLLVDDGEGQIVLGTPTTTKEIGKKVGDIIYTHGLVVFTDEDYADFFSGFDSTTVNWKSRQSIYTSNYTCKVRDEEFNFSLNPSSIKDNNGNIADNLTGTEFKPYVTTIGLYNDDQELIAVAKLGQPIPKSTDTDMTFVVKLDV